MISKGLTAITWKEEKLWVSQCLNVDIASVGKTQEEALQNLQEALELYFEDGRSAALSPITHGSVSVHELDHA